MLMGDNKQKGKQKRTNYDNFAALKISIASPDTIRSWSRGEVKKSETINYKSYKPEKEGLFCERIFGPTKDYECSCGKYKKIRYAGTVCDRCGVTVTRAKVRREWMGHIELAVPVAHIWYVRGIPSKMALLLDLSPKNLESVINYAAYIVTDPGDTGLDKFAVLNEEDYNEYKEMFPDDHAFAVGIGAEAVKKILKNIDLGKFSSETREEIKTAGTLKKKRLLKKLDVIDSFITGKTRPEWMVLDCIPVIPPELRPMVQIGGGRFATADLNDLYRRVINRNNRLKKLIASNAPDIILRNEKRLLQSAVDALIDNGRNGKAVMSTSDRPYKSLSELLKGKQGRFRQNLLGKRVDFSGRSVIVIGPELKFYQCGLPKDMAVELFKPFVMNELLRTGKAPYLKIAKMMIDEKEQPVWDALDEVIKGKTVLLNRAPTLHRLGIQAFEPVLVEGHAMKLHPLVCTAFNADFDGDQMAVHLPLSVEAQAEARYLMLSINNILAPKDGSPITTPTQDMILGCYYLTRDGDPGKDAGNENESEGEKKIKSFMGYDEMLIAHTSNIVKLHDRVRVKVFAGKDDKRGKLVESTVGRFIFNKGIPQDLGFVDRKKDPYSLEIDMRCGKKELGEIIARCFTKHQNTITSEVLDYIKEMGFHYSTVAAVTIGVSDMEIPKRKKEIISEAEEKVNRIEETYEEGMMTEQEKTDQIISVWAEATDEIGESLMKNLDPSNNLFIMADSGARGSSGQIRQIGGMRGLMANAKGETVEIPIKSNFREGLSVLEFFISSNGARKGLTDTALRTAESGYLTRRLVDISHGVIVTEEDCGSEDYLEVEEIVSDKTVLEPLSERIIGRTAFEDIKVGREVIKKNELITEEMAEKIDRAGIKTVKIRSALTCKSKTGVCAKCYGRNLGTGGQVAIGDAVGVIAAQSIGEPGTQLTMRTFHTGGVASEKDITQGLPRVEELFEVRSPKINGLITRVTGTVESAKPMPDGSKEVRVVRTDIAPDESDKVQVEHVYRTPRNFIYGLTVKKGDKVQAGDALTEGPLNPTDIMEYKGAKGVFDYLLTEIQKTYRLQGVDINDRHIEVIASQMLAKWELLDPGDTMLSPGAYYQKQEIEDANESLEEGLRPAVAKQKLLGITKASLGTASFLSAASFQETTRVLTDAAIKAKTDTLDGLKENVIVGRLIPAGTGMGKYTSLEIDYKDKAQYMIPPPEENEGELGVDEIRAIKDIGGIAPDGESKEAS